MVAIPDDMDEFAELLWNSLNEDNKVSLFVRYIDIETGKYDPSLWLAYDIAQLFHMTIEEVFIFKESERK